MKVPAEAAAAMATAEMFNLFLLDLQIAELHLHVAKLTQKASNIKWITTLSTFLSPLQGISYSETAFLVVWVLLFCF